MYAKPSCHKFYAQKSFSYPGHARRDDDNKNTLKPPATRAAEPKPSPPGRAQKIGRFKLFRNLSEKPVPPLELGTIADDANTQNV